MYGTYQRLRVHVWASPLTVIRAARKKLAKEAFRPEHKDARKRFYRTMLEHHKHEQDMCLEWRM